MREWKCKNGDCNATVQAWKGQDTTCERCGQEYNGFGQMLRSGWQDNPANWNDDISDLEGYEMQYAWDE